MTRAFVSILWNFRIFWDYPSAEIMISRRFLSHPGVFPRHQSHRQKFCTQGSCRYMYIYICTSDNITSLSFLVVTLSDFFRFSLDMLNEPFDKTWVTMPLLRRWPSICLCPTWGKASVLLRGSGLSQQRCGRRILKGKSVSISYGRHGVNC